MGETSRKGALIDSCRVVPRGPRTRSRIVPDESSGAARRGYEQRPESVWGCEVNVEQCFALARFETHVWTYVSRRGVGLRVNVERVFRAHASLKQTFGRMFRAGRGVASQR